MRREEIARRFGLTCMAMAGLDLLILHLLPTPWLRATTGELIRYRPMNFLSEFVRTEYAPLMSICFVLLALTACATAVAVRSLNREKLLLLLAGSGLLLLFLFPTDLADLRTDLMTCDIPGRIEPCTLVGRIHNPLSTGVFVPILGFIVSICVRYRKRPEWQFLIRFAVFCGVFAVAGIIFALLYQADIHWHGRWWTGLMQRSLTFPALLWLGSFLSVPVQQVESE